MNDQEIHKGLPVAGYQPQSEDAVALVNLNKLSEERLLRRMDSLQQAGAADPRFLAIARTHFDLGFIALNRAIFKPTRVKLPEDDDGA